MNQPLAPDTAPAEPASGPVAPHAATAALSDAGQQVLRRFRVVFNAVKSHQQQTVRQAGLTGAQVWALNLIARHPGLGIKGLAQLMDVRQPTASILAKALVQLGLVESLREAQDRRATQLQVTPAGRKLLARAPGPVAGVLPEALATLDATTLAQLARGLDQLIQALQADPQSRHVLLSPLHPG
jgi:DNA-binding MarR family transcriptional regulator